MANAKEFVDHVAKIEGVAGCLLVRNDGVLLGQSIDDPEAYATLMVLGGTQGQEIMERLGFSFCRHISFRRQNKQHLYVFPIEHYFLGVLQSGEVASANLLDGIHRLLDRVHIGRK